MFILLLEDRATDADLIERQLRRGGTTAEIVRVDTEEGFRDALRQSTPDIILADYHLPTFDGLSALEIARAAVPEVPFLFVSGSIGEERAVEALRRGATDYVLKDRLTRLPAAVERAVEAREERQRARAVESDLRDVEERFGYAMAATHDLIWEWDVRAGTVWTNRDGSHERSTRALRPVEELLQRVHPDDLDRVSRTVLGAMESNAATAVVEYRIQAPDGSWRWVIDRQVFLRAPDGEALRVIGAVMDVTEQKVAEHERQRLARRNELVLESVQHGICGLDTSARIRFANASAARLLGRRREDLLGVTLHAIAHHRRADGTLLPADECPIVGAAQTGRTHSCETVFWRTDGSSFPVAVECAPVLDDGAVAGIVVSFSDLTERRRLERQLEQARRISDMGRIATTMAHEFNNVLMGIQPFVDALGRRSNDEAVHRIAAQLARSTQRGKAITQEILRFAVDSELDLVPIDVGAWLDELTAELRMLLDRRTLVVEPPDEPLTISGDAGALHQVMTNLVINARDATPAGGTVTIAVRRYDGGELPFAAAARPARSLHLTVADDGSGMTADVVERVFDPMFTTKPKGNGLGLPFVYRTITGHGGQIFVASEPGNGTVFHIFLPLRDER